MAAAEKFEHVSNSCARDEREVRAERGESPQAEAVASRTGQAMPRPY